MLCTQTFFHPNHFQVPYKELDIHLMSIQETTNLPLSHSAAHCEEANKPLGIRSGFLCSLGPLAGCLRPLLQPVPRHCPLILDKKPLLYTLDWMFMGRLVPPISCAEFTLFNGEENLQYTVALRRTEEMRVCLSFRMPLSLVQNRNREELLL